MHLAPNSLWFSCRQVSYRGHPSYESIHMWGWSVHLGDYKPIDTLYLNTSWNQECIILKDTATCKENWSTLVVCDATSDEHTVTSAHWVGGSHTTRLVVELYRLQLDTVISALSGWRRFVVTTMLTASLMMVVIDTGISGSTLTSYCCLTLRAVIKFTTVNTVTSCSAQSLNPHSNFSLPNVHCCIYTRSIVAASSCLNTDCLREPCDLCTCAHSGIVLIDGYAWYVTTEVRFGFHRVFSTDFSLRGSPYRSSERFLVTFFAWWSPFTRTKAVIVIEISRRGSRNYCSCITSFISWAWFFREEFWLRGCSKYQPHPGR